MTAWFQPTRPRRARHIILHFNFSPLCFNPRAHEGRDINVPGGASPIIVSTHAPTKGATPWSLSLPLSFVFQPTRPRRARPSVPVSGNRVERFNPRAHEGRDTPRGSHAFGEVFQPTRPRRARRRWCSSRRPPTCFNPRAHEGRDLRHGFDLKQVRVSTHAPTKGATPDQRECPRARQVSTHAPTKGATYFCGQPNFLSRGFNPRAHEGRDSPTASRSSGRLCFNPRAHEGRDQLQVCWLSR